MKEDGISIYLSIFLSFYLSIYITKFCDLHDQKSSKQAGVSELAAILPLIPWFIIIAFIPTPPTAYSNSRYTGSERFCNRWIALSQQIPTYTGGDNFVKPPIGFPVLTIFEDFQRFSHQNQKETVGFQKMFPSIVCPSNIDPATHSATLPYASVSVSFASWSWSPETLAVYTFAWARKKSHNVLWRTNPLESIWTGFDVCVF